MKLRGPAPASPLATAVGIPASAARLQVAPSQQPASEQRRSFSTRLPRTGVGDARRRPVSSRAMEPAPGLGWGWAALVLLFAASLLTVSAWLLQFARGWWRGRGRGRPAEVPRGTAAGLWASLLRLGSARAEVAGARGLLASLFAFRSFRENWQRAWLRALNEQARRHGVSRGARAGGAQGAGALPLSLRLRLDSAWRRSGRSWSPFGRGTGLSSLRQGPGLPSGGEGNEQHRPLRPCCGPGVVGRAWGPPPPPR